MAKPILVVNYCIEGLDPGTIVRNLKHIQEVIEGSGANDDYYTFVLPVKGDSYIQVFYDKDIDDNSFNNIRDIIDEKLQEIGDLQISEENEGDYNVEISWWKKLLIWKK